MPKELLGTCNLPHLSLGSSQNPQFKKSDLLWTTTGLPKQQSYWNLRIMDNNKTTSQYFSRIPLILMQHGLLKPVVTQLAVLQQLWKMKLMFQPDNLNALPA